MLRAAFLLLALAPALFAARQTEVDVVVDMSPEGRKVQRPTPQHPAFYLPIMGGFTEAGATVRGEREHAPSPHEVAHLIATTLADQGYLVCNPAKGRRPTLIFAIHWGSIKPEIEDFGAPGADPTEDPSAATVFFNQAQMLGMVGGNTLHNLDLDFEREQVMQAAEEDRYFIMISAYDFATYRKSRKKLLLWQAKMSVPSNGVWMQDVLAALVKAGGPLLGRETIRPKMLILPTTPEGRVEIGTPTVKDYQDAPPPPAPPQKNSK
jgi:hypothetical protein